MLHHCGEAFEISWFTNWLDKVYRPISMVSAMRHPCYGHGIGCWWLLLKPKHMWYEIFTLYHDSQILHVLTASWGCSVYMQPMTLQFYLFCMDIFSWELQDWMIKPQSSSLLTAKLWPTCSAHNRSGGIIMDTVIQVYSGRLHYVLWMVQMLRRFAVLHTRFCIETQWQWSTNGALNAPAVLQRSNPDCIIEPTLPCNNIVMGHDIGVCHKLCQSLTPSVFWLD